MLSFSILDWKYSFWGNLVQKIEFASLSWNLVPRQIWTCWIQWCFSLSPLLTGNNLFGYIWCKKSLYAEFRGDIHFISFRVKAPCLSNFGQKNLNCQFKLKFGTNNHFIIFWGFLMFYQVFLSPRVIWGTIIRS